MDLAPEKKEAFIVTQEFCAGRKKIPLGSIGCFVEGKHSKGCIVDMKSRPVIALMSSHIKPLSPHQAALLLTIESPQKRHSLFCNEPLFSSICCLRIHDVLQLRYGRVATVGIVRGFWERRRKPGSGELRMVLIEVELLDPGIIALGNSFSRLKINASQIVAVSSSTANPLQCKEIDQRSLKKEGSYIMEHLAEGDAEAAWERDILQKMEGTRKGIQGHCNSCYLDTTLYSLFSFSSALDGILYSPEVQDSAVQQILRQQIVQPLRQHGYVGAENVMNLRRLLRCDSFVTEEKDPEEFLNVLLREVLSVEPLLKIRSDNEVLEYNCYQILAEKEATIKVPTVQQLLEKSLLSYGLRLDEMPRFGKSYKKFSSVYPSLELDLTDMVEQAPQVCCVCGGEAANICSRCRLDSLLHPKLMKLFENLSKVQRSNERLFHDGKLLSHRIGAKHPYKRPGPNSPSTKKHTLHLFAVLCIESSHYVAFVRYGPLRHSWLFFDSMAGTLQNEKGTKIPVVKACPQIGDYLAMTPEEFATVDTKQMDAFSRRFFCDAYTFMYQKPQHASYWFRN